MFTNRRQNVLRTFTVSVRTVVSNDKQPCLPGALLNLLSKLKNKQLF